MTTPITSLQNPLIKSIVKLQQKASERKNSGTFVVEGRREVSLALRHGIEPEKLIICPDIFVTDPVYPISFEAVDSKKRIEVSSAVYNKMAYREGTEGIILLGKSRLLGLNEYKPATNTLIIVLQGVEKPGNLGAILRTTDAAAADAIFLCDARTDPFNPNAIRASLGCLFSQKVILCSTEEAIAWFRKNGIRICAAAPETSNLYFDIDFKKPTAIIFGAEDAGLSTTWIKQADHVIKIPMGGVIDSLNVAASVAIITFEAVRQRIAD
jgi:RNA methyltransferase, TrmH family